MTPSADSPRAAQTLPEVLGGLASSRRGIRYLQGDGRESAVSYAELWRRACGLLGHFQRRGLKPGDAVLLFVRNNVAFIDAFWACQLGGLVPVPLSAAVHSERLQKLATVAGEFQAPFLFTERELLRRLAAQDGADRAFAERVCLTEEIAGLDGAAALHRAAPQDTALMQFSSGSTSQPKGVVLSHANLLANIRAMSAAAAITGSDLTLSWMPLSHDMGLIGFHLVPLYNGLPQVLMDTGLFLRTPARWLQAAQEASATLLCSPNFGYQLYLRAAPTPDEGLDLSRVRLIFNGAEPVSALVCREFAARLAATGLDARAFYPVYGLAEASLAVSFPVPGTGVRSLGLAADRLSPGDTVASAGEGERSLELVCVGHPVAGCEVRICDAGGMRLPQRTLGRILIRGASVTRGYHRRPACDDALTGEGWLDTGDLGFLDRDGLYIAGRARDVLFVHGQNWYPQDLEQLLEREAELGPGKVAVAAARRTDNSADRLLVFVQHRRGVEGFGEVATRVRAALSAHAGLDADAVIPVARLPRTTSGKLQRYRLSEAFEKGAYDAVLASPVLRDAQLASCAESDVERQLLDICQRTLAGRSVERDQSLFELGADSLMLVQIHQEIEARFPGRVEVTDLFDYPTVAALAAYLGRS
ncbi:MAG: AMP-binding protein [Gammaproteobacteria bacterium]